MNPLVLRSVRAIAPLLFPQVAHETQLFPPTVGIDREQAEFFQRNGYLVKRGVVPPEQTARVVDHIWSLLPGRFDRCDPSTWDGAVEDSLGESNVRALKGQLKFRESIRGEQWLYEMIEKSPCIRSTVEAMIGSSRTAPLPYIRGLYPTLPVTGNSFKRRRPRPHTDRHRFLVGSVTYLSDVAPGGGGFHVWPGSHHLTTRRCFKTCAGPSWTARYHRELYSLAVRSPALEIVAPAGSTIFWHHRLAHAAGVNRTNEIRYALLADFPSTDIDDLAKKPVGSDLWDHWNFSLQSSGS